MSSELPIFPLSSVLFPGARLALHIFEPRYKKMLADILAQEGTFGVALIRNGSEVADAEVNFYDIGTEAALLSVTELPQARYAVETLGARRFQITNLLCKEPYIIARVTWLPSIVEEDDVRDLARRVHACFDQYQQLVAQFVQDAAPVEIPDNAEALSFTVAASLHVADPLKQRLLEHASVHARLSVEYGFLRRLLPQLRSMLERKAQGEGDTQDNHFPKTQYFGKYFSLN